MSSTQEQFGKGAETIMFELDTPNSKGERRTCLGQNTHCPEGRWFGCIGKMGRINPSGLSFCECCAKLNFQPQQLFEVTEEEYPGLKSVLVCDMMLTDRCLRNGIDSRCLHYGGFRVNINLINQADTKWSPACRIPTEAAKQAAKVGTHIVGIPTFTGWECCIRGDPNGIYKCSNM